MAANHSVKAMAGRNIAGTILIISLALAGLGCFVFPIWLLLCKQYVIKNDVNSADAIGLISALLALFSGVMAVLALSAAVTAWWLQAQFEKFKQEGQRLESVSRTLALNSVGIIDTIWKYIPQMTYTQQIPFDLVLTLQGAERFIVENKWALSGPADVIT